MDTFKEKQHLDDMYARGDARWELWKQPESLVRGEQAPVQSVRLRAAK